MLENTYHAGQYIPCWTMHTMLCKWNEKLNIQHCRNNSKINIKII
jgi:hypothetical protein